VVVLNSITFFGMNGPLETSLATASVGGMRFMGIEDGQDQSMQRWRKSLGPLQTRVYLMLDISQCVHMDALAYPPHGISAGQFFAQATSPKMALAGLVQGVE
jgi:hypothetical protein